MLLHYQSGPEALALLGGMKLCGLWFWKAGKADEAKGPAKPAGAEGSVGAVLEALDPERFRVFNELQAEFGTIDHLIVRRDGALFVIEARSHWGEVTAQGAQLLRDGKPFAKDFIAETVAVFAGFKDHVTAYADQDIRVNGILCFTGGTVKVKAPIRGLQVLPVKSLASALELGAGDSYLKDWLWENMGAITAGTPKVEE